MVFVHAEVKSSETIWRDGRRQKGSRRRRRALAKEETGGRGEGSEVESRNGGKRDEEETKKTRPGQHARSSPAACGARRPGHARHCSAGGACRTLGHENTRACVIISPPGSTSTAIATDAAAASVASSRRRAIDVLLSSRPGAGLFVLLRQALFKGGWCWQKYNKCKDQKGAHERVLSPRTNSGSM